MSENVFVNLINSIKLRHKHRTQDKRKFKQKQKAIYQESTIVYRLREQLLEAERKLYSDPHIQSITLSIAIEAYPHFDDVKSILQCEITPLTDRRFLMTRKDIYV